MYHLPPRKRRLYKRSCGLLPKKGPPAYRILAAPAHIPCAGDIIARFVEFGKVRNCLPPRVGKAKENPPAGDGLPRRCAPRNDGELGIDFFPYHVILKIKRGVAGRREPPHDITEVTVKRVRLGRLLLFIIYLDDQGNDADDQNTELKQVGIGHHAITPLLCSGGGKEVSASSRRRGLPPTEYWQRQRISMRRGYYSTFCRIWQSQLRYVLIYVLRLAPGGVLCYGIARKIREVFL